MTKTEEDNFKSLGEVLGNVLEKIKPAGRVEKYVLPEKCRADFVKENGVYRKLSTIERYCRRGYLSIVKGYSEKERCAAGRRLYADFFRGGLSSARAIDPSIIRVDGDAGGMCENKEYFRSCYNRAIREIPAEFYPAVHRVCIEDQDLAAGGNNYCRYNTLFADRRDLCRGLDRLIKFYLNNHLKLYFVDLSKLSH